MIIQLSAKSTLTLFKPSNIDEDMANSSILLLSRKWGGGFFRGQMFRLFLTYYFLWNMIYYLEIIPRNIFHNLQVNVH